MIDITVDSLVVNATPKSTPFRQCVNEIAPVGSSPPLDGIERASGNPKVVRVSRIEYAFDGSRKHLVGFLVTLSDGREFYETEPLLRPGRAMEGAKSFLTRASVKRQSPAEASQSLRSPISGFVEVHNAKSAAPNSHLRIVSCTP